MLIPNFCTVDIYLHLSERACVNCPSGLENFGLEKFVCLVKCGFPSFFLPKKPTDTQKSHSVLNLCNSISPQRHLDTMVSYWDNILFVIWVYIPLELQWKCCISM